MKSDLALFGSTQKTCLCISQPFSITTTPGLFWRNFQQKFLTCAGTGRGGRFQSGFFDTGRARLQRVQRFGRYQMVTIVIRVPVNANCETNFGRSKLTITVIIITGNLL